MARSLKPLSVQDLLNRILDGTLFAIGVYEVGAQAGTSGQNATVGTSGGTLAASYGCQQVLVQADAGNGTKTMSIGFDATTLPIDMVTGEAITIPVRNVNLIYVKVDSGTGTANWLALPDIAP